jgi:AraC-like DNA-binding protein
MEAKLEFYYHTVREQNEDIYFHAHQCYELVYYLKGRGQTIMGETEYNFQPSEFAIIHPRTLHDEKHNEATEVMFVGFSCADPVPELIEGLYTDLPGQPICTLMKRMALEMQQQQTYYTNMLNALMNELLVLLTRSTNPISSTQQRDKIQYARAFIDEHFTQKIDFSSLSRQSGYSYDRFRHLFKEMLGCSPTNYILRKRIEHALMLLSHSEQQISIIAQECGFFNDAQFCSLFKRETGVTPGKYRRQRGV